MNSQARVDCSGEQLTPEAVRLLLDKMEATKEEIRSDGMPNGPKRSLEFQADCIRCLPRWCDKQILAYVNSKLLTKA